MNREIVDYCIAIKDNELELELRVKNMLNYDWQPFGPHSVLFCRDDESFYYSQTLVKYKELNND